MMVKKKIVESSYTEEDLVTDAEWLKGSGVDAEKFLREIIKRSGGRIMTDKTQAGD
jgi:hypothetical protein